MSININIEYMYIYTYIHMPTYIHMYIDLHGPDTPQHSPINNSTPYFSNHIFQWRDCDRCSKLCGTHR